MNIPRTYLGKEDILLNTNDLKLRVIISPTPCQIGEEPYYKQNNPGTGVGPGGCNRTLARKQKYRYYQIVATHLFA